MPLDLLVVEDDLAAQRVYRHILHQTDYRVRYAERGDEALQLLTEKSADIILLDRVLPDMDGMVLCQQVRAHPHWQNSYILIITGVHTNETDVIKSLHTGADDYIYKPVSAQALLARLSVAARIRQTQLALQAQREEFRALAENAPDMIIRLDRQLIPRYVNPMLSLYSGVSAAAVVGRSDNILNLPQTVRDQWDDRVKQVFENKKTTDFHFILPRERAPTNYFEVRLAPEFDAGGEVKSVIAVVRNETEQVEMQRENAQVAALASALRQADRAQAVIDTTLDSLMADVSAYAVAVGLLNSEGGIALKDHRARGPIMEQRYLAAGSGVSAQVLASGQPYLTAEAAEDSRVIYREQAPANMAAICVPLIAQDQPMGVIWVLRTMVFSPVEVRMISSMADIAAATLHRALLFAGVQEEAMALEQQVALRTQELRQANERLLELDQVKSQFITDVNHELRTPITNLRLYLQLLDRADETTRPRYLTVLRQQTEHLAAFVEQIMYIAELSLDIGPPPPMVAVDLNSLIDQLLEAAIPNTQTRQIGLDFSLDPDLPKVCGLSRKLAHLLTILLNNAMNYNRPGGKIEVT